MRVDRKKGEPWAAFQARKATEELKAKEMARAFAAHEDLGRRFSWKKTADKIDGYDRDDLGPSNDY